MSSNDNTQIKKPDTTWSVLREVFIEAIDQIDEATPGNGAMIEPDWWSDMMDAHRALRGRHGRKKTDAPKRDQIDALEFLIDALKEKQSALKREVAESEAKYKTGDRIIYGRNRKTGVIVHPTIHLTGIIREWDQRAYIVDQHYKNGKTRRESWTVEESEIHGKAE